MCWLAGESTNPTRRHPEGALSILLFMHRSLALRMFNVAEIEIGLIDWFWWTYLLSSRYHSFFLLKEWTHFCSKQHTVTKWSKNVTVKGIYTAGPASPMFPPYAPPLPSVVLRTFKQQPDAPTHMSERFRDMSLLTRDPPSTPPPQITRNMKEEGGSKTMQETCCTVSCLPTSLGTKKPAWQARNLQAIEIHSRYICITSFKEITIVKYHLDNFT